MRQNFRVSARTGPGRFSFRQPPAGLSQIRPSRETTCRTPELVMQSAVGLVSMNLHARTRAKRKGDKMRFKPFSLLWAMTLALLMGPAIMSGCFKGNDTPTATLPQPEPFPEPIGHFERPASSPEAATDPLFDSIIDRWKAQHALSAPAVGIESEGVCEDATLRWVNNNVSVTEGETMTIKATVDVADSWQETGFQRIGLNYNTSGLGITAAAAGNAAYSIYNNFDGYGPTDYVGLVTGPTSNTFQLFDHPSQWTFVFTVEGLAAGVYYIEYTPSGSGWALCGQQFVIDTDGDDDGNCLLCDDDDTAGEGGDGGFALGVGPSGNRCKVTVYGLE